MNPNSPASSRVLVLSVHSPHLDRRIVHQMNALAASGRRVTLVSVPAHVPKELLDPRVEVVADLPEDPAARTAEVVATAPPPAPLAPPAKKPSTPAWVLRCGRMFPDPIYRTVRWLRWTMLPAAVHWTTTAVEWMKNVLSAVGPFAAEFWQQQIAEPYRRRWPKTTDPELLQFFVSATPRRNYTAIHCHDLPTLPVAAALRRRFFPHSKIIYDSHELYPYQLEDKVFQLRWKRVERRWIGKTAAVIAVNASIADCLAREHRISPPVVLYNSHVAENRPAAVSRRDYLRLFGIQEGGFDVLFQGNLFENRNLSALVRAFALLEEDCRLLIIGSGPAEAELRDLARETNNVFFGGWVEQGRLLGYTRHASCGVIPYQPLTLNHRLCTPNKLFEFLEARLPLCLSDLPELRRFVEEGRAGAVYDLSTPGAIAEALCDFRRRVESGEFSEDRFRQADTVYGWPAQEKRLLDLYRRLAI